MDKVKVGQLKIQMQQWLNEAEEFINDIPPVQLYTAVGVVLSTLILLLIKFSSKRFIAPLDDESKVSSKLGYNESFTKCEGKDLLNLAVCRGTCTCVRLFKRTTSNTIVLTGLSGGGKTFLFYQLRDGSAHQGTMTSMEPNEGSFILHSEEDKGKMDLIIADGPSVFSLKGKLKPVHVVDVPGHSRLRPKLDEFLPQAAGVVFVVDSVEFLPNCRPASEYLYEILTKASVVKKKVPVLLLCNKVDKVTAHTAEFIRKQLEKEIDKLRTSRTVVSDADISNEYTLGVPGEPFAFSQCHNRVIVAEASGLTGEISQLEKFIRENVKP
ncbi:hypothetical protein MTR67_014772 [Solanum verrucosum]|uniref:Signal recognition particle receptor subunit beta n=1 Tax=Solanum verrucosum TaxID=315347 RepID=A0AAF0QCW6_SOLVR|nr:hypothetical protein MTR67_014772 [Solanum verrucosum]